MLDSILPFFAKFIESELGIVYAEHNYYQLQNRLEEIALKLNINDVQGLYELAQKGIHGQFRQMLLDLSTNNETSFFRDAKMFASIEECVIPAFLQRYGDTETLNIWSAACSSGQEALSVSILINEWSLKNSKSIPYKITCTDVSERILTQAQAALYSQLEVQRGLSPSVLNKYFKKDDSGKWKANAEITKNISYQKLNLKDKYPFSKKFFLILCRNVLIYQSVQGKTEILNKLIDQLEPNGFLILGSGESLLGLCTSCDIVNVSGAVIYRKKSYKLSAS